MKQRTHNESVWDEFLAERQIKLNPLETILYFCAKSEEEKYEVLKIATNRGLDERIEEVFAYLRGRKK